MHVLILLFKKRLQQLKNSGAKKNQYEIEGFTSQDLKKAGYTIEEARSIFPCNKCVRVR